MILIENFIKKYILRILGVNICSKGAKIISLPIINIHPTSLVNIAENVSFFRGKEEFTYKNCIGGRKNTILKIGSNCTFISTIIDVRKLVCIGNNCFFEEGVVIIDSDAHSLNYKDRRNPILDDINKIDRAIYIGNNVYIGKGSIILKGVSIGDNVRIMPYSVISKNIPSGYNAEGNPTKIISNVK